MRWVRGVDENQIVTDDDRFAIYKHAPDCFAAWGPQGSQDVDYIRANTARMLRDELGSGCHPEDLQIVAGRGLLGLFTGPDEARAACREYDDQGLPPASRSTDPETSHEAEDALTRSGQRAAQMAAAEEAVRQHPGRTSKRLAIVTGMDRHMLGRRLPDLEKLRRARRGEPADDPVGRGVTWWPVYEDAR